MIIQIAFVWVWVNLPRTAAFTTGNQNNEKLDMKISSGKSIYGVVALRSAHAQQLCLRAPSRQTD